MTAYSIYEAIVDDLDAYFKRYMVPASTDMAALMNLTAYVKETGKKLLHIPISIETATAVAMAYIDYQKADGDAQAFYALVEKPLSRLAAREGYIKSESGRKIPFIVARQQMEDDIYFAVRQRTAATDFQTLYEAYCDAFRKAHGISPHLERYYMTVKEAKKMDEESREDHGISFQAADEKEEIKVFSDYCGHTGISFNGQEFATTEAIDLDELYYCDYAGPVYKDYPIQNFIKGIWPEEWKKKKREQDRMYKKWAAFTPEVYERMKRIFHQ